MQPAGDTLRCGFAALARRPAVTAAALFMLGIFAHVSLAHRPVIYITAAVAMAMLAMGHFRHAMTSSACLAAAVFLIAIAAAQIEAYFYSPYDVAAYAADDPRLARLELRIDDAPRIIGINANNPRPMPPKQVTRATCLRVLTRDGWRGATGKMLVQLDPPCDRLAIGQHVRVFGLLQRPGPAMNPGQFDWEHYYREQRVLTSVTIPHADAIEFLAPAHLSPLDRLQTLVREKLAAGFGSAQSLDHALLRALVLGDNDPELRDVQEQFRRTGTSHHLAISGMHVAVLGAVVFGLCRLIRLTPRRSAVICGIMVILYGAAALPSPPVVRSVLLCLAFAAGVCSRRGSDAIQLLALSVLLMLIYHPLDLYNAGFQLSFGTVLGLMLLTRRVAPMLGAHDPYAAAANAAISVNIPLRERIKHRAKSYFAPMLAAAVIAWMVSLPLVAFHFEQLNPWAIFASILLAPFVFLALIGGFLKIILTLLLPMFATTWAAVAAVPVMWMRHVVAALARMPGSDVPMPAPTLWLIAGYYALLLLPLLPAAIPLLRRVRKFAPAGALAMLAMSPVANSLSNGNGELRVTVLAVGAGACSVVELPNGKTILLDAGSASLQDLQRKCLGPFLRHEGRRSIDQIWLSHGDFDHISAASEIASAYDVSEVMLSPHFRKHASESAPAERLLETLDQLRVPIHLIRAGDRVDLGGGAAIEVLWPPEQSSMNSNNAGLVLRLNYNRHSILFPADIQEPAERALLRPEQANLHADVLIAPHHGSSESSTRDFVAAVDPQFVVSSNDRTLTQKQRAFETMVWDRPLYRTNKCGAVTIMIHKDGQLEVSSFLKPR